MRGTELGATVLAPTTSGRHPAVVYVLAVTSVLRQGWRPTRRQGLWVIGVTGGTSLQLVAAAYYGLFAFPR